MGVDLRLLPFDADQGDFAFSHTILEVNGSRDLYKKIKQLRSMPVPKDFTSFCAVGSDGESTYGLTKETPYGEPLEWALAGELCDILSRSDDYKKAVYGYLQHLSPDTKVALYWH
jgi:hypothetical protein